MVAAVWKAQLRPVDLQEIEVPIGAEILCAREQYEEIMIWYRCNPIAAKEQRKIAICGTGNPAPDEHSGRYVGTALLKSGRLVLHVFEQLR